MSKFSKLLLLSGFWLVAGHAPAQEVASCPEKIASELLDAIVSRDKDALVSIANNRETFDNESLEYIVGDRNFRFPGRRDLMSAYALLANKKTLTKITITDLTDQAQKKIDIVYLPISTAPDFIELTKMVGRNQALLFRDYITCTLIVRDGVISMPNACYAETDALD